MNYQLVGADEQSTSVLPFVNLFDPTKFEYSSEHIAQILEAKKHSDLTRWFSWLKPEKVSAWLKIYILEARKAHTPLTVATEISYVNKFVTSYGYKQADAQAYCDAFLEAHQAGYIDDVIFNPAGYKPQSTLQDIKDMLDDTSKAAAWNFLPWVIGGIAAYAFVTGFLPNMAANVTRGLSSRK